MEIMVCCSKRKSYVLINKIKYITLLRTLDIKFQGHYIGVEGSDEVNESTSTVQTGFNFKITPTNFTYFGSLELKESSFTCSLLRSPLSFSPENTYLGLCDNKIMKTVSLGRLLW
jgi:hypothetical protein